MRTLRSIAFGIIEFVVVWFINTVTLLITAWAIPGISILSTTNASKLVIATVAALKGLSVTHADQTEQDYQLLVEAVNAGRIQAETGVQKTEIF